MIFGFNTDIKQGDTVYHVQSEARESELLLQTQVFVRGRCIGKHATPYGDKLAGGFTDQQKEQACATSTAWCSMPSATAGWTMFWISAKPRKPWPPSKNWTCIGSMPILSTPTAI